MDHIGKQHYIPGLDGLRAIAMLSIIAYHFNFSWSRGGFLGVDVFFVLSGYLITSKILSLKEESDDFHLKKFWMGRIQRLLPSVYVMILITVGWVILLHPELIMKLWGDIGSSMIYLTNWWFIFHKLSYFDSFGTPSPFKHLWFLAVQEQFFIIWPIVLNIGLKYLKKSKKFLTIVFILVICSAFLMGIMYNPEEDPSRIYYGTDTRAFELLIGSCLAFALPIKKFSKTNITMKQKHGINIIGILALVVFISSAVLGNEYQGAFLYRGGILLISLNTVVLILCIFHSAGFLDKIFSWKALRWIGTRAYGIYLWHYPIIVLSTPIHEIGKPAYWRVSLQFIITLILAELNYRFIETPIRKLGLREFYKKSLSFFILKWRGFTLIKKISLVVGSLSVAVIVIAAHAAGNTRNVEETEIIMAGTDQSALCMNYKPTSCEIGGVSFEGTVEEIFIESLDKKDETSSLASDKSYEEILAVGDSVMLNIASNLEKKYTNITVDGKVSRQMSSAIELASTYENYNYENKAVIIQLGTNGPFTDKQIDSVLDSFSKADTYLVNTRVPRKWEKTVNEVLKKKAEERENVILVDWYSIAIDHPEYFGDDGVHLTSSGAEALANFIEEVLTSNLHNKNNGKNPE